jgi:hypothetical protein
MLKPLLSKNKNEEVIEEVEIECNNFRVVAREVEE